MTDLRKAAEMVLEVLDKNYGQIATNIAITDLRRALDEPDHRDKDIADLTKACQVLLRENLRLQEELNK